MSNSPQREYNCKDEDLPVISGFAAYSLERDQAEFLSYSPKFSPEYITGFKTTIDSVNEIVMPEEETLVLKKITERLYGYMDALKDPINRVEGYLGMAKPGLNINPTEFGLTLLRKNAAAKNAEGTISSLRTVNANLARYNAELSTQGLTPELSSKFTDASAPIQEDNKKQYEILTNRKSIVHDNIGLFNSLNAQLVEILRVGKILYKASNPVKAEEYNFASLKKKVRSSSKPGGTPAPEAPAA